MVKDRYLDIIGDEELVLIQTRKLNNDGQEMYQYSSYAEAFIPCRKSVMVGTYEIILDEISIDDIDPSQVRRVQD